MADSDEKLVIIGFIITFVSMYLIFIIMKHLFIQLNGVIVLFFTFSFHCMGADTYPLKYELETGKTYKQDMVSTMDMKMEVMGQEMNIDVTTEMNLNYDVIGQTDGILDIRTSYQRIKINMTVPGALSPLIIDSDSPENSFNQSIGDVVKSLVGIPIDIQLSQQGKVISVKGADKFAEKFDTIVNVQFKQMLEQMFSAKAIQTTYERIIPSFPDEPVAIGDSWNVALDLNSGGVDISSKMHLTLTQVEGDIATLECTGTLTTPEGGATLQIQGMDAKVSSAGEQAGTVLIDMKTGWVVRSEITQNYKQHIEIMGQEMIQYIEGKTTITAD